MGLQHNANVILVAGDPKPRQYTLQIYILLIYLFICLLSYLLTYSACASHSV